MAAPLSAHPEPSKTVALDDISATEWRKCRGTASRDDVAVALDDISATEWRTSRLSRASSMRYCIRVEVSGLRDDPL